MHSVLVSWPYVRAILEMDPSLFTRDELLVALRIADKYDERYRFRALACLPNV